MKLEWIRQPVFDTDDEVIRFSGEITLREVERLNLDAFDRKLLDECGSSKKAEDWLLALEMLFRRQREQTSNARVQAAAEGGRACNDLLGDAPTTENK